MKILNLVRINLILSCSFHSAWTTPEDLSRQDDHLRPPESVLQRYESWWYLDLMKLFERVGVEEWASNFEAMRISFTQSTASDFDLEEENGVYKVIFVWGVETQHSPRLSCFRISWQGKHNNYFSKVKREEIKLESQEIEADPKIFMLIRQAVEKMTFQVRHRRDGANYEPTYHANEFWSFTHEGWQGGESVGTVESGRVALLREIFVTLERHIMNREEGALEKVRALCETILK